MSVALLRALIPDQAEPHVFTDEELETYLALDENNIYRVAWVVVSAIAQNESLTFKYLRTDDQVIDGTKSADIVMKRAAQLQEEAQRLDERQADEAFIISYSAPPSVLDDRYCHPEATPWPLV